MSELKAEEHSRAKTFAEVNRFSDWMTENEPAVNEEAVGGNVQNKIKELKVSCKQIHNGASKNYENLIQKLQQRKFF